MRHLDFDYENSTDEEYEEYEEYEEPAAEQVVEEEKTETEEKYQSSVDLPPLHVLKSPGKFMDWLDTNVYRG